MNAIKNITIGHTERLRKPVGYTVLANLVNIIPFMLSIEVVNILFRAFDGSGQQLPGGVSRERGYGQDGAGAEAGE